MSFAGPWVDIVASKNIASLPAKILDHNHQEILKIENKTTVLTSLISVYTPLSIVEESILYQLIGFSVSGKQWLTTVGLLSWI